MGTAYTRGYGCESTEEAHLNFCGERKERGGSVPGVFPGKGDA